MRISIVGPGALGSLPAAPLKEGIDGLWLLDHQRQRARSVTGTGILLEENGNSARCFLTVTADSMEIGGCDVLFLRVKSRDIPSALRFSTMLHARCAKALSHGDRDHQRHHCCPWSAFLHSNAGQ